MQKICKTKHKNTGETFDTYFLFYDLNFVLYIEFGGIYMDPDVLVLRSFDPLRRFPLTLARQSLTPVHTISNGVIISRPAAFFMRLWIESYKTFDPKSWAYHSVYVPAK